MSAAAIMANHPKWISASSFLLFRRGSQASMRNKETRSPEPLAREIRYAEVSDMVRWVTVKTPAGARRVLTFWASLKQSPLTYKAGSNLQARQSLGYMSAAQRVVAGKSKPRRVYGRVENLGVLGPLFPDQRK